MRIHCIGDSHVSVFSGLDGVGQNYDALPFFKTYWIGPHTAYNAPERWETIGAIVAEHVEAGDKILLCFGEIDCRVHLIKQARLRKEPLEKVVRECVDRYFGVFTMLKDRGRDVMAWNAPPPSVEDIEFGEYSTYGTYPERLEVTRTFNRILEELCTAHGIPFISIFERLLGPEGLTNPLYFMDEIHLSQRAMPFIIDEFKKIGINLLPEGGEIPHGGTAADGKTFPAEAPVKAVETGLAGHRIINMVYGHLLESQMHAFCKKNVSVVWSSTPLKDCDLYAYLNAFSFAGKQAGKDVLLLWEPYVVLPGQWDDRIWNCFDHVFTIYSALTVNRPRFGRVDGPRSGWIVPADITEDREERERKYPLKDRKNAICMINGHKKSEIPGELYSKRFEAAQWFHENSDMPFDVYGNPPFPLPNYRGILDPDKKLPTLAEYMFSLCFENLYHPEYGTGYITEKVLDCLEARTVPVYLGCADIEKYIPEECYIDFRSFRDFGELERFLGAMSRKRYKKYVHSIDEWVTAGNLRKYSWQALYDALAELVGEGREDAAGAGWTDGISPVIKDRLWEAAKAAPVWTYEHLASTIPPLVNAIIREQGKGADLLGRVGQAGPSADESCLKLQKVKSPDWSLKGSFLRQMGDAFSPDVFVETGTYIGNTTYEASTVFPEVHSIEFGRPLYERAVDRFRDMKKIFLYHGDSVSRLPEIMERTDGKRTLLWLDAHYSEGITEKAGKNTPVLEEIEVLGRSPGKEGLIVLLDDLRFFHDYAEEVPEESSLRDYPTVPEVCEAFLHINDSFRFAVIGDILLVYPDDSGVTLSPVLRGCTVSRIFDGANMETGAVLLAEEAIGEAAGEELRAIQGLVKDNLTSENLGIGGHYRLWHGLTLRQRGLYDDACHEFLAAQKTGVRHWRVNWYLAQSAYRAGNLTLALKALDEVRQAAPGFTAPKDLAEELAAAAGSDNSPSRPTVSGRLALAKFFENNGRYEEALAETDLVIASGTMDPTIHYQFAQLLIVTGRIDKSIPALNTVVSLNPRHTYAHNDLGVIYLQQGRQDEAISAFECAVSADNHNLNALRNLLGVVIAGGNREGAMAVIRQLLAAYPGDKGLEGVTKEFGLPLDMAAGALKNPPSSGGAPEGEAEAFRKKAADYYEEMTALYEADSPENPARQLVHPVWKAQLDTLGALILEGIPENFLFHPICLEMFVRGGWQKQQEYELQYLEGLDGPLRDRIFSVPETAVGHLPRNCPGHDISINTLGMLWYCARIQERLTGEISSVVEFGGGFGSFARAFNLLMEKPLTYSIIDLPEMLALQLYYLGLSLGEERVVAHKDTAEPPAAGKVNLYPVYGIAQSSLSADLFVSTFALSETPAFTQDFVCRTRDFFGAPRVYITGQLESERTELGWQKPQGIVISALHRYRHLELNHFHIGANYELIGSDEESRPLGAAERGRSLSATPGDSRQRDPEKPVGIIFSKDRAMQLDCTLSSLSLHCRDMAGLDMHVLYATSDLLHERQYEELKKVYPAITFVKERMFKEDLSSLLRGRKYVLFLVDDNIFVNDFNAADAVKGLDEDPEALGFSLRLGRNTTYCYMLNKAQALPPFRTAGKKVLGFDWTAAELDFGYPLEVSSSFYRVEDLLPLMALDYKNPNTLELMFDSNKHIFRDRKKSLLCFESSVTFCNPVNMVQTMWVNRAGGKGDYSPLKLAEMFDRGLRVDAGAYSGLVPKGCHQEVDFIFSGNREAPPGPNPERPLVSVMIISYNGIDHIKPCIESIQRNTDEDYEIVVVDNARNDGSIDYLRTVPGLTLVENPTNIGYSPARAQAMALVRGDYIVSIDDDTVVTKGWVRRFIDHAKAHPELGIIGPMSNYVSNAQLVQNAVYHNVHEMDTFAETLSRENEGRLTYTNKLIGFCMFIPRKVLETIGCIDYNFGAFFGFDDDDYSLRAQAAGFKLAIAHDIFIHHTGGPQGKGDAAYNQSLLGAWEIFKKKWDLPSDLPYGQPYSVGHILEGPFDKKRHFIPAPDPKELEPLIYRGAATRSVIPTSATDDGELLGRKVDDAFASAKAAADRGNWEEAASIFGRLIEEYPDLGVAHAGLGSVLVAMKEYDRAIIVLSKTLEMLPTEMEVWNQLATAFLLSGRGANAIEVLENALSIEPDNVELLTATAGLCLSEKEYGKAITWVSNAIERDPGCVEAISLLGRISIEIGDGEAAKVVLEKLNKVTPGHPVIFEMEEAMGLKPSGQAEEEASEEGKESGESIVDLYNQAILSYEKGETDGALRQFEKILEMDKEKPEVLNDAGVLYFQKGDKDKAVSYLREAVRLDPENFDYLRNLADICLDSGKVDEAAGHYGDILRKEPENVEVMVIAAQLCFGAGLEEDARVYMDRVREIDPDNEFIRQNIVAQA